VVEPATLIAEDKARYSWNRDILIHGTPKITRGHAAGVTPWNGGRRAALRTVQKDVQPFLNGLPPCSHCHVCALFEDEREGHFDVGIPSCIGDITSAYTGCILVQLMA